MIRRAALTGALAATLIVAVTHTHTSDAAQESPLPASTGNFVVDNADLLSPAEESRLETFLRRVEAEMSVQVVVVTVPQVEGSIEEYSLSLFRAWEIGQGETDNGALVFVSGDDRRMRIEVGDGLEGVIPDGLAGRIMRNEMAPRFQTGDFAGGFQAGAIAIAQAAHGEYAGAGTGAVNQGDPTSRFGSSTSGRVSSRPRGIGTMILFGVLILMQLLGYIGNAFHPAGAAAAGGVIAVVLVLLGVGALFWLLPLGVLGGLGATVFTRASAGRRSGWGYGGTSGGIGNLWIPMMMMRGLGGGFGGGGFGGGGGFVGGGGSASGGGASGSW